MKRICGYFSFFACLRKNTVFTRIRAAVPIKFFAPKVRRLIEGGVYSRAALI